MKSFNEISLTLFIIIFILLILEVYYLRHSSAVRHENFSEEKVRKSIASGAIRGGLTGLLLYGIEGGLAGVAIMGVVNPVILGVESFL